MKNMMKRDKKGCSNVIVLALLALLLGVLAPVQAAEILNPGFEDGWDDWTDVDPSGTGTAISDVKKSGTWSIKLSETASYVTQDITVKPNTRYSLKAYVSGKGNLGVKVGKDMYFEQQTRSGKRWRKLTVNFNSGSANMASIFASHGSKDVRFDDFEIIPMEAEEGDDTDTSTRIISSSSGGFGLSPDLPPGKNFDLMGWFVNTPGDKNDDGIADKFAEVQLGRGAFDERYFYTGEDGGMVFKATVAGATTSKNAIYTRTELREMLRRGDESISTKPSGSLPNKNNWVLSSAPRKSRRAAGGVDGTLKATLAINHVTKTGSTADAGAVIIAQIHGIADELARLYYKKLPGHRRGSIYIAHEVAGASEEYFKLIGDRSSDAEEPADGIALDEQFSFELRTEGNELHVVISQAGAIIAKRMIDMTFSGYDAPEQYLFFRVGVVNQSKTADPDDYVQATFYQLSTDHD